MKIFFCLTKDGTIKKMTLNKVIMKKRRGSPVKIISVAEIITKNKKEKK